MKFRGISPRFKNLTFRFLLILSFFTLIYAFYFIFLSPSQEETPRKNFEIQDFSKINANNDYHSSFLQSFQENYRTNNYGHKYEDEATIIASDQAKSQKSLSTLLISGEKQNTNEEDKEKQNTKEEEEDKEKQIANEEDQKEVDEDRKVNKVSERKKLLLLLLIAAKKILINKKDFTPRK